MIYIIILLIILNLVTAYFLLQNFCLRKLIENNACEVFDDYEKENKDLKQENEKKDEEIVRLTLENNRLTTQIKFNLKKCKKQKK